MKGLYEIIEYSVAIRNVYKLNRIISETSILFEVINVFLNFKFVIRKSEQNFKAEKITRKFLMGLME
jgi:hypothetical protein